MSIPTKNDFGSSLAKARLADQSSRQKAAVETPKPRPSTRSREIPQRIASTVRPEQSQTRAKRITKVYNVHNYGGWRTHSYSNDYFHPMLTGYLLGNLSNSATFGPSSMWVYHHWNEMDQVRREELLRENGRLRAELDSMRARGVPVDPNYSMPGLDPDLTYNDQTASNLYTSPSWTWGGFFKGVFILTAVVVAVYAGYYAVCRLRVFGG